MTVGKDVSALFPDVVNCMQTDNLELKKLVYLYLMNYAKSQPDMAIMAVNTFVKVWIKNVILNGLMIFLLKIIYFSICSFYSIFLWIYPFLCWLSAKWSGWNPKYIIWIYFMMYVVWLRRVYMQETLGRNYSWLMLFVQKD